MIVPFSDLVGKVISSVSVIYDGDREILFTMKDGTQYRMCHYQDCCEDVNIEDIVGDFNDIIKTEVLKAEVRTNTGNEDYGTYTWTFYHIATINGCVDIR